MDEGEGVEGEEVAEELSSLSAGASGVKVPEMSAASGTVETVPS